MNRNRLVVQDLEVEIQGKKLISGVSFEVSSGAVTALIGPNGAGKTTLLKAVAGVLETHRIVGKVLLNDEELGAMPFAQRAKQITYLSGEIRTEFPLLAEQVVALGSPPFSVNWAAVRALMKRCHCDTFARREFISLSGGEKQLVCLAMALFQGTRILLLDEALAKLDLRHQLEVSVLLKELAGEGYHIFLVSHDIHFALSIADQVLLMRSGVLLGHEQIAEVFNSNRLREVFDGVSFKVSQGTQTGKPQIEHFLTRI